MARGTLDPIVPAFTSTLPSKQTVPDATVQSLFDRASQSTPRAGVDPAAVPKGPDFGGQTTNPYADLWNTSGKNPQSFVSAYIAQKGLRGAQADPTALNDILGVLKGQGVNAALDTRSDGLHKGLMIDGQFVKMLDGSDNWIWNAGGDTGASGSVYPGSTAQGYAGNQFSDPSTQQYENLLKEAIARLQQPVNDPNQAALADLLKQQTAYLQQQQQAQIAANEKLKGQQAQAQTSMGKYVDYANQRATELQGPAYTASEQNILKTAATDPIEADRQASLKRALDNIGSRGFDPSSGIAQELMLNVNNAADRGRNGAQNALSVQQINEQRSRQQEAQALLGAIPQAQMAAANGDQSFLQSLNSAVNGLGASAATSATQAAALSQSARDQAAAQENELLSRAGQLYQLPMNAAQGAMSALGQAPNPSDMTAQSIQLAQLAQQKQSANSNFWLQLGTSFAPFFGK